MRITIASVLLAVAVFCVGCGGVTSKVTTTSPQALHITWIDDGNPKVPICSTVLVSCKTNLIVVDMTTGLRTPLPLSVTSFDAPIPMDTYAVHVVGYDSTGKAIESVCCTVVLK